MVQDIIANLDKSTVFKSNLIFENNKAENSDENIIHKVHNSEFSPNDLPLKQIDLDVSKFYNLNSTII